MRSGGKYRLIAIGQNSSDGCAMQWFCTLQAFQFSVVDEIDILPTDHEKLIIDQSHTL